MRLAGISTYGLIAELSNEIPPEPSFASNLLSEKVLFIFPSLVP
jgi:hypothetical protein